MTKVEKDKSKNAQGSKTTILYDEGDELFSQVNAQALAYENAKGQRDEGEDKRKAAQGKLHELLERAAKTEGVAPEDIDAIECGPKDPTGKRYVFRVTKSKRSSVNVQKLLEAGIPASVIEACTDVNDVESWGIAFTKS